MTYNLLEEPWIPVLWNNGKVNRVGIKVALTQAGRIRQIAASNPMDNVSLLRLLLAVLQWCKPSLSSEERASLKDSNGVPEAWLDRLSESRHRFDLMDAGSPFYQDPDVRNTKLTPVTNLLHETPSGTNIAHFNHTRDFQSGLCLACCAVAILRWSAYASAGTAGAGESMTAVPNGNSPAYCITTGNTLLATISSNWPQQDMEKGDLAIWDGADETTALGPLKGLTWRSRRILLDKPDPPSSKQGSQERCLFCGEQATSGLVRRVYFRPGWKRPQEGWKKDPHLLRIELANKKAIVPSAPGPDDSMDSRVAQWRLLRRGILQRRVGSYTTTLVGSNQQLFKDAFARHDLVYSETVSKHAIETLEHLEAIIRVTSAPHANGNSWQAPPKGHVIVRALYHEKAERALAHALRAVLAALGPAIETRLDIMFGNTIQANTTIDQEIHTRWLSAVEKVLNDNVCLAITITCGGSPLRRREALAKAQRALGQALTRSFIQPAAGVSGKSGLGHLQRGNP